jgi:hypothetical protein
VIQQEGFYLKTGFHEGWQGTKLNGDFSGSPYIPYQNERVTLLLFFTALKIGCKYSAAFFHFKKPCFLCISLLMRQKRTD